ncbi:hypothetical protein [Nocardioides sp.]|uniref:hypothetical protein n=1 Tax=Nocardioides sp. TaxID=35761 RepID=UPI002ED8DB98
MIDTGISVAWLADFDSQAQSVMDRVWKSLRVDPEWKTWLSEYTTDDEPDPMIQFDDRTKPRLMLRGAALSYFVPIGYVTAAREARNLKSFAADLFRDIYVKWAEKRGLPEPPAVTDEHLEAVASRFP